MTSKAMPESYDEREQAFIKHTLLEAYLQKLFLILGAGSQGRFIELCYVDCFAGPWGDASEGMDGTSIAVSLRTLESCRKALEALGVKVKFRALFVEKDDQAFERLEAYLKSATPQGIESACRHGDFVALRREILAWAGSQSFAFFFVDPKGWKDVGIEKLRMLLQRPRSEMLVNFMYNFVNRTMSMSALQDDMVQLIGEKVNLSGMQPNQREDRILSAYRSNLKSCVPSNGNFPARSAYVRIMHRTKERTWYHLVYLTSHPQGIIQFMKISEGVNLVQKQVRAGKKGAEREERTGTADFFADEPIDQANAGRASQDDVDRFWRHYLCNGPRCVGRSEFASILEDTNWFESDLQGALARLIKAGALRNLDFEGKRPKRPLHFEVRSGERLELVAA